MPWCALLSLPGQASVGGMIVRVVASEHRMHASLHPVPPVASIQPAIRRLFWALCADTPGVVGRLVFRGGRPASVARYFGPDFVRAQHQPPHHPQFRPCTLHQPPRKASNYE
jgi:hypothetical protein